MRASRAGWPRLPVAVLILAVVAAGVGPLLPLPDPYGQDFAALNEGPSMAHLLGTDELGGDVLSRLLLGCRLSLSFGLLAAMVALGAGGLLGLLAMAIGGAVEIGLFAVVDLVRAMPGILFALAMVAALEPGTLSVILALGVSFAPIFARIVASTWRREQAAGYVAAARCFGAGRMRTAFVHILPNMLGPLVTQFAIILPRCIVSESVLSFIGLGVSPETPTWGRMISAGALSLEEAPHAVLAPVVALALLTWSLSMLADRVRRVADPLRRQL